MTTLTYAMTLLTLTQTLVASPLLTGAVAVGFIACFALAPRKDKALRKMNTRTQADIGLSPYAPSWLAIQK